MFLIEGAPLTFIPPSKDETFFYFSKKQLKEGSIFLAPLGKRKEIFLTIKSEPAEKKKIEIKKFYPFFLKKIEKILWEKSFLKKEHIKLAKKISDYFFCSFGKTLKLFFPYYLLEKIKKGKLKEDFSFPEILPQDSFEKRFILTSFEEIPEKEIKKVLSQKKQILFLFPEKEKFSFFEKKLKKLFPKVIFFSHDLPFKTFKEVFFEIKKGEALIITGSRSALFAPFSNLSLVLVFDPQNKNYFSEKEPKIFAPKVAEILAKFWSAKMISFFPFLFPEDYFEYKNKISFSPNFLSFKKNINEIKKDLFDLRKEKQKIISKSALNLIEKYLKEKKKILLFIERKGEGKGIFCQDCGWQKKCENCDAPMTAHQENHERFLLCHFCQKKEKIPALCEKCKSFRVKILGKGTQKLEKELKKIFPQTKILRFEKNIFSSPEEEKKVLNSFLKEGEILITTSLILKYLPLKEKIPLVGIISLDSLLSLPDFSAEKEAMHTLIYLLGEAKERFFLQTFFKESKIAKAIKNLKLFLVESLKERKKFNFPPFFNFLKFEMERKKDFLLKKEAEILKKTLKDNLQKYKIFGEVIGPCVPLVSKIKGKHRLFVVLKFKGEIKKEKILENISPKWKIERNTPLLI